MADIFVSYTSSDKDRAFLIGRELKALGHTPRIHEWEIRPGENIYDWMERRLEAADHVLCVFSEDYLQADYSRVERHAALWKAAKRDGFVLPVVVKPCTLPVILQHVLRCEVAGRSDDEVRQGFRDYMARMNPRPPSAASVKVVAASNVPIHVPEHFLGRDEDLRSLETSLKRYDGRVTVTALHGLRGVGKTTLAAAFADRKRNDYRATWWLRAQTPETLRADLAALGVKLGWVGKDEKEEPARAEVMDRLRSEGEGILLIYDNAIDAKTIRPFLPRGGSAQILVTSNDSAWRGIAQPVEIRLWPREIGADYLIARTGRAAERADAEALSEALGGLPLAHEQAAAYCERLRRSLAEYRRRFAATPASLLDTEKDAPTEYHDGLTVAKTFALAIDEAAKLHPAAEPLIVHAALLAPEPIPLFLFAEGRETLGEPLASLLAEDGLDEAVAALAAFALVDRESIPDERDPAITTDCLRLHRLVRQVAASRGENAPHAAMLGAMAGVYPTGVFNDPTTWPKARRLDALALALIDEGSAAAVADETAAAKLLNRLASYRQSALATYGQARPLFERALTIRERVLGPEHTDTTSSLNNLAGLLLSQGDLLGARPLFERALAISERVLGPEHPDIATNLNNLANLLQAQGDLSRARPLYERALAIKERTLGPEHRSTATTLSNLASLLYSQDDLSGARPLFERALAIFERMLGPEHPDTATSLNNLALLLKTQGDLSGARPLYERDLAISELVLGPEHPDTATSLNNLAGLLLSQGDLLGARPLFERALAISERVLGPEHPDTATRLNNLAHLLWAQGDLSGARPLYERALAISERVLGPEHPQTRIIAASTDSLIAARAQADPTENAGARPEAVTNRGAGAEPTLLAKLWRGARSRWA